MKKIGKLITSAIAGMVAIFTGCQSRDVVVMYMGPIPDLQITGTVTDKATEQQISEIRVFLLSGNETNFVEMTSSNGYYFIILQALETNSFTLIANDKDGTNNGEYLPTSYSLVFDNTPIHTNINIELDPKK